MLINGKFGVALCLGPQFSPGRQTRMLPSGNSYRGEPDVNRVQVVPVVGTSEPEENDLNDLNQY
jgi:hypothetical protein